MAICFKVCVLCLLLKFYHHMVLGRITISSLSKIDKTVRGFVRQWLALPNDTPTAYFHAPVSEGGLSIPSLRWITPLQRRKKLIAMLPNHNIGEVEDSYLAREIALCPRRFTCKDGNVIHCLSGLDCPRDWNWSRWNKMITYIYSHRTQKS